jgi:hypothetical protein
MRLDVMCYAELSVFSFAMHIGVQIYVDVPRVSLQCACILFAVCPSEF